MSRNRDVTCAGATVAQDWAAEVHHQSDIYVQPQPSQERQRPLEVALLTGGGDKHYAFGLATALVDQNVQLDFIGGDELVCPELLETTGLRFLNYRRNGHRGAGLPEKIYRLFAYYGRLLAYSATASPNIFHILWNNKFELFDRTLLMAYYRLLGRTVVLTAHNVNAGLRDANDSLVNRISLRIQYRLASGIFVHTEQMKRQLINDFNVPAERLYVIPYGINNALPHTSLTCADARARLGVPQHRKTLLFFGNIAPYKGLEYLVSAFQRLPDDYHLIIAGRPSKGSEDYAAQIETSLAKDTSPRRTTLCLRFVPDDEVELYFKAADVMVLPYKHIFQSGVLFMGYSFGIPVIAADVGGLKSDVVDGVTGYVFGAGDVDALVDRIEAYFAGELYTNSDACRQSIRAYAEARHSWDEVAAITRNVYSSLARTPVV